MFHYIVCMQSQDTRNIIIIWWATIIGGILNYLVHPLAVRILSTAEFWQFAALLSMINIMWFIMSAGTIITLKLIADHENKSDFMYYLKHKLAKPLIGIWLSVCLLVAICSPWIAHELQISHIRWVVIMSTTIIFSLYAIILNAILQSGGWFKSISLIGIIGSLVRLIFVIIALGRVGWSSTSTVWSIVIAGLVSLALTEYFVRRHLGHSSTTKHNITQYDGVLMQELKQKFNSYLSLIIVTVMIGILTNSDVLIAQHVFGSENAGVYASVAIIAKFVIFIGLASETVLLPKLLKADTKPNRSQIWSIIGLLWWFWIISLIGSRWLWAPILDLLKPWLWIYQPLLIWAIIINWCILTLSISSKTIVNQWSRIPLWIIGIWAVIWYIISRTSNSLWWYIQLSAIILLIMSFMMQAYWLLSTTNKKTS